MLQRIAGEAAGDWRRTRTQRWTARCRAEIDPDTRLLNDVVILAEVVDRRRVRRERVGRRRTDSAGRDAAAARLADRRVARRIGLDDHNTGKADAGGKDAVLNKVWIGIDCMSEPAHRPWHL